MARISVTMPAKLATGDDRYYKVGYQPDASPLVFRFRFLQVEHDDGTKDELSPGDAYVIEPGHDAWVDGNESFVALEFESKSAEAYAKGS